MALAAAHRVAFSVLAVPFAAQFQLSLPVMGIVQSAFLFGYALGQVIPIPCLLIRYLRGSWAKDLLKLT